LKFDYGLFDYEITRNQISK